ncbi:MAG: MFS transporter [Treponema sp.]|nr:MFS transporter [Treponema sp.]
MTTQKRALVAIYIISFVLLLQGFTGTTIAYIIDSYSEVPPMSVQQIVSLPAIFGLIVSFAIGPIAMKINKKYLTIICAVMILIYFAIFAFVGSNGPLSLLLFATVFAGIAQGSAMTLASSMVGEFVGAEKSANYVAISLAMMNGGGALINIIGGAIAAGNGGANWPQSYYLGALLIPAIIAFGFLMPKEPEGAKADAHAAHEGAGGAQAAPVEKGKLPGRDIAIGVLAIFSSVCICGFLFYISVYIVNEFKLGTTVEAGLANSIFTITGLVTGFTYSIWAKLFKKALIVVSFGLVVAALFCMMTFTTTLFGAFAAALLLGWGFNMMNPYIMGFIMQITPPRLAPVGISILMAGANVGMFIAIYVLNFLSGLMGGGLKNVLLICTVGMAICTVAAFFVYRTKDAPAQEAAKAA